MRPKGADSPDIAGKMGVAELQRRQNEAATSHAEASADLQAHRARAWKSIGYLVELLFLWALLGPVVLALVAVARMVIG